MCRTTNKILVIEYKGSIEILEISYHKLWGNTSSFFIRKLLTALQQRYALFFKSSAGRTVKAAGPPAIATSLARSIGSTRQTSQINERIKINDNLNRLLKLRD